MIRGGLFTRYCLQDGIRQTPQDQALATDEVARFALEQRARWSRLAAMANPSEAETESEFIHPVLDRLGWHTPQWKLGMYPTDSLARSA